MQHHPGSRGHWLILRQLVKLGELERRTIVLTTWAVHSPHDLLAVGVADTLCRDGRICMLQCANIVSSGMG